MYAKVNTREVATEYRLSHWAQIVQERIKGGLSIREYCKQIGICENTYFYWQRRLRKAACEQLNHFESEQKRVAQTSFVEIEVAETPVPPALPAPTEVTPAPSQLSIEAAGVRIMTDSTYPPAKLAALLRELMRPC